MTVVKNSRKNIRSLIDLRKSTEYVKEVNSIINREFLFIKNKFISKFNNHPVTVEIEAGPNSSNTSRTLSKKGNLFSFIGFEKGDRPIAPIRSLFKEIFINKVVVKKDGSVDTVVYYPKAEEYFAVTPLPWANGRSWADGIEKGISGLGFYLNEKNANSRSGTGIQTKGELSKTSFQPTDYLRKLIKDFEVEILNLNRLTF